MIPLMYTELSGASIWCFHIEWPQGAPWGWVQWLRAPQQAADLSPSGVPSLEEKLAGKKIYDKPRQRFKKQRLYFEDKGVYSQSYGFSSSHVWLWELDYKEGWVLKNWCFWTVELEKTLESPLDSKEIQPGSPQGNQSWLFIERTDTEADTSIFLPPDVKRWLIGKDPDVGKDWRQE